MLSFNSAAVLYGSRHRTTRKRKPDDVDKELETAMNAVRSEALGPFWFQASTTIASARGLFHVGLQQRERVELEELVRKGLVSDAFLAQTLVPLNDESSDVPRLRMYNWAVTNYAKGHGITTQIVDAATGTVRLIDPSISYNATLKRLHRTLFDPYRRGTLLFFKVGDATHHTTVGQLLFVRWCLENGIDAYVAAHEAEIREHLNATTRARAGMGSQRVKELTQARAKQARLITVETIEVKDGVLVKK